LKRDVIEERRHPACICASLVWNIDAIRATIQLRHANFHKFIQRRLQSAPANNRFRMQHALRVYGKRLLIVQKVFVEQLKTKHRSDYDKRCRSTDSQIQPQLSSTSMADRQKRSAHCSAGLPASRRKSFRAFLLSARDHIRHGLRQQSASELKLLATDRHIQPILSCRQ